MSIQTFAFSWSIIDSYAGAKSIPRVMSGYCFPRGESIMRIKGLRSNPILSWWIYSIVDDLCIYFWQYTHDLIYLMCLIRYVYWTKYLSTGYYTNFQNYDSIIKNIVTSTLCILERLYESWPVYVRNACCISPGREKRT